MHTATIQLYSTEDFTNGKILLRLDALLLSSRLSKVTFRKCSTLRIFAQGSLQVECGHRTRNLTAER